MQSLKRTIFWLLIFSSVIPVSVKAQQKPLLKGVVTDEFKHPLAGAAVQLLPVNEGAVTDGRGRFAISVPERDTYVLRCSFLGYRTFTDTISLHENKVLNIQLVAENKELSELTVVKSVKKPIANSLSVDVADKQFLIENTAGSLMQTLSRIPGVSSIDIGAGQSKPVIRGLGFNRVAVAENGIKHEAQEWGSDHGLEIDQFSVEKVEVIKGPASLMYGGNAIGGVIDLQQIATPAKNSTDGTVLLNMQSNNDNYGMSARFMQRFNRFYYKLQGTYTDYSDYRVPVDSINYMTYNIRLHNRRLRNSAGRERNGGLTMGYLDGGFSSHLTISNNFSKSGFFANAHGLEIRNSQIDYDHSSRDIDLPRQQVNHFKVLSNTIWMLTDYKLNIDLGYQNNYRQEFSERVAHGYMPLPPDTLERLYNKNTWSANIKLEMPKHNLHRFTTGTEVEYQDNSTGGWGFMLPDFRYFSAGAFVYDNVHLSDKWQLHAGLRYDYGKLISSAYYDWYTTPQSDGSGVYVQRAHALSRDWGSVSWGVGSVYNKGDFNLKVNVGKSFRTPTAKELASNGINYHMYRFEKGDSALKAEQSYQLDLGMSWNKKKWTLELTPFVNYFPNYIYLNPTASYYEAQQIYYYSQSSVFRTGGEASFHVDLTKQTEVNLDAEYIYSRQLSGSKKGYTLPFSPPLSTNLEFKYKPHSKGFFERPSFGTLLKLVSAQNSIVPPEKKTPGYMLWNISAGTGIRAGQTLLQLNMQVMNVLNTTYYDHTSFYRLIEVPGQGRNLVVSLSIPFGNSLN